MKVPRKAEERAEDFKAFVKALLEGLRSVRRRFKGR
jgi:hypothetical protein